MVDSARSRLVGRDLYVRTSLWYDSVGNAMAGLEIYPRQGYRCRAGQSGLSREGDFLHPAGKECPDTASVFMSVGAESHSARNFAALFNFSNPRDRYPMITDANWERIIHGRVAVDTDTRRMPPRSWLSVAYRQVSGHECIWRALDI